MISKIVLLEKIEKVVHKLMNLGVPVFDEGEVLQGEKATSKGIIARDFGIKEWDWPQGVGLYGIKKLADFKKSKEYDEFLVNWYKGNIDFGLPSINVNTTAPMLTLIEICEISDDEGFEKLCLEWANYVMNDFARTKEDVLQHVTTSLSGRNDVMLNENQVWIDTIFMVVLFINKMSIKYKNEEWFDFSVYQILAHIKYLYEKKNGLFYHGFTFDGNSNFGEIFWCRGNSWFTFGIVDFLEASEEKLSVSVKEYLVNTFKAQVKALVKLQSEKGLWHTILDDDSSYLETSGSSAIALGILKGVRLGFLDKSYLKCGLKAIEAIVNEIKEDGTVDNVSGGTGMGYDKEHYKNIIIAPMAYGQSLTLVALTEALNHFE